MDEEKDVLIDWVLPIGIKTATGIQRDVEIAEMNGYDEEYLLDNAKNNATTKTLVGLVVRLVKRIGDIKEITEEMIYNLLAGDFNYLLIAIRSVSLGKELDFTVQCPNCQEKINWTQDLTQLEVKKLDETKTEIKVELEKGYKDTQGVIHKTAVLRLLTVKDQELITVLSKEPGKMLNAMLIRSISRLGSLPTVNQEIVRTLTKKDRDLILREINKSTPGIDLSVNITCDSCGNTFKTPLGAENFFGYKAM